MYFQSKRSLIFFKRTTDEFETYMLEGGYARRQFRMGVVRLSLEPNQHRAMRRLHGQTMTTAQHLADDLDDLSEFLGAADQTSIDAIQTRLATIDKFPDQYRDVTTLARDVIKLYQDLVGDVGERERFEEE